MRGANTAGSLLGRRGGSGAADLRPKPDALLLYCFGGVRAIPWRFI